MNQEFEDAFITPAIRAFVETVRKSPELRDDLVEIADHGFDPAPIARHVANMYGMAIEMALKDRVTLTRLLVV